MYTGNDQSTTPRKWRKVAYGGMQPGFDDNHTDESFLEQMAMNTNVVVRDLVKEKAIEHLVGMLMRFCKFVFSFFFGWFDLLFIRGYMYIIRWYWRPRPRPKPQPESQ